MNADGVEFAIAPSIVIAAKAGIRRRLARGGVWTPAFAGVTIEYQSTARSISASICVHLWLN